MPSFSTCGTSSAQQVNVKIGVLTDMSSLYADATGIGSVIAAKMAAADFMKDHPNFKIEVISGDHQNKPDIGSQIANQWYDVDKSTDHRHAELRRGVGGQPDHRYKNKVFIVSGRGCIRSHRSEMQRQHNPLDL